MRRQAPAESAAQRGARTPGLTAALAGGRQAASDALRARRSLGDAVAAGL